MTQIDALKTDEIQNYEIEHQEEVRRLAGECMVILENDGVLPLQAGTKKIALFGTGARHTMNTMHSTAGLHSSMILQRRQKTSMPARVTWN